PRRARRAPLPMVREVRGRGLIIGIQLDRDAGELVGRARQAGLLINVTAGSVVRLLPPLVIDDQELDFLADTLSRVLVEFARDSERP
ncbi:aminotransferase class III-fold pyridoxal phosphate-dependent enzyme, partial [Alloalcanivorax marinus]|uniref:aminotransferase class III-fold pyridoxal phosphate-dependent enzyme n=1 Tax=Alloalcanivorax marinus TaxID=1177169 RepID=UPI0021CFA9AB